VIAEWRQGVHDYLATQFPAAAVLSGQQDGVVRDKDTILVWFPGWKVLGRDIALSTPTLTLRYFPARSKQPSATIPPDPQPLEAATDALIAAFHRATQVPGFFTDGLACYLADVTPNYQPELWRVEATLASYALGVAA
jgi:hypothetical protein